MSSRRNFHFTAKLPLHQARNQLGTQGGEVFSEKGPNFLNYVQYVFPVGGRKVFLGEVSPACTLLVTCLLFIASVAFPFQVDIGSFN